MFRYMFRYLMKFIIIIISFLCTSRSLPLAKRLSLLDECLAKRLSLLAECHTGRGKGEAEEKERQRRGLFARRPLLTSPALVSRALLWRPSLFYSYLINNKIKKRAGRQRGS